MNRIWVIGRNAKDIEVHFEENNKKKEVFAIAKGAIATNEYFEETGTFINYVAFGKTAEFIDKYAWKKGQKIFIGGYIKQNSYTDKEGNKRYSYDLVVDKVEPIDRLENEEDEEVKPSTKKSSRSRR